MNQQVPIYMNDGFQYNRQHKQHGVKKIDVKYVMSNYDIDRTLTPRGADERIRQELVNGLIKELYNSEFIEFVKSNNPNAYETEYLARINVADKTFTNVVLNERAFYVDNKEFSEDSNLRI